MKLRSKLVIGFTTLLALMLVLTLIGYDRISYMNDQMDQIYQDRYQRFVTPAQCAEKLTIWHESLRI